MLGSAHLAPRLGIILGSGLSGVADALAAKRSVAFERIPGFVPPSVAGHAGVLHVGFMSECPCVVLAGRVHLYEGVSPRRIAHLVETLSLLGVRDLLLCNAAGGIARSAAPGSIMLITDHIDLTWSNPLIVRRESSEMTFTDMSAPYDSRLLQLLREAAGERGIALDEGTYAGVAGPSYETAAEVRMLATLGASAVGMSTVSEVIVARSLGLRCAVLSCITNYASGIRSQRLSHEDVVRTAASAEEKVAALVREFAHRLATLPA